MRIAGDLSYKSKILCLRGHRCFIHEILSQHGVHLMCTFLQWQPSIVHVFLPEVSILIIFILLHGMCVIDRNGLAGLQSPFLYIGHQTLIVGQLQVSFYDVLHSSRINHLGGNLWTWCFPKTSRPSNISTMQSVHASIGENNPIKCNDPQPKTEKKNPALFPALGVLWICFSLDHHISLSGGEVPRQLLKVLSSTRPGHIV